MKLWVKIMYIFDQDKCNYYYTFILIISLTLQLILNFRNEIYVTILFFIFFFFLIHIIM